MSDTPQGYLTEPPKPEPTPQDDDAKLLQKTAVLHVAYTAPNGNVYEGDITNNILTIAQKISVDVARARMAGGLQPEAMTDRYFNLLYAICWLKVSVTAGPPWAINLADSTDEDLVGAIWQQVLRHEDRFCGRKGSQKAG